MAYVIPDSKWEMPELLMPRQSVAGRPLAIDWSNPLTQGLTGCFVLGGSKVSALNIVNGRQATQGDGAVYSPTSVDFPTNIGVTTAIHIDPELTYPDSAHTYVAVIKLGGGAFRHIVGKRDDALVDQMRLDGANKIQFAASGGSVTGSTNLRFPVDYIGQVFTIGATVDGSDNVNIYHHGLNDGSGTVTITGSVGGFPTIGAIGAGAQNSAACEIERVMIWNRELSAGEMLSVELNYNQLLIPA